MAKKHETPKNNWMDTYGDMVTLLLCFFVLLFSISTVNAEKWIMIVKSFNPASAKNISQLIQEEPTENEGDKAIGQKAGGLMTDEENFDQIFWSMKQFVADNNLEESIEVKKGKDFTFIIFRNNVFFNGDSYILRDEGKFVLDALCEGIRPAANQIGELRVMGHTNQADPNVVNPIAADRFLSSNRATEVLVYIQEKNLLSGKVLVSEGFGQYYPIGAFDNVEDRAKNRRVEIYIAKNDAVKYNIDEIYKNIDEKASDAAPQEKPKDNKSKPKQIEEAV